MSDILQVDGGDTASEYSNSGSGYSSVLHSSDYSSNRYSATDGEITLDSDSSDYSSSVEESDDNDDQPRRIEVISGLPSYQQYHTEPPVWYEEYVPRPASLPSTRHTVRRDSRFERCGMLPTVSVPNARSIFPKINRFLEDMKMRSISVSLISETWHKESKKKHVHEVQRILNMEGIKFVSAARPGGRRGGGCGIAADLTHYNLDKLDMPNPDKVEMC